MDGTAKHIFPILTTVLVEFVVSCVITSITPDVLRLTDWIAAAIEDKA